MCRYHLGFYSDMRALSVLADIDYKSITYNIDGLWQVACQDAGGGDVVELQAEFVLTRSSLSSCQGDECFA